MNIFVNVCMFFIQFFFLCLNVCAQTVVLISYFGHRHNRARLVGRGASLIGVGCLLFLSTNLYIGTTPTPDKSGPSSVTTVHPLLAKAPKDSLGLSSGVVQEASGLDVQQLLKAQNEPLFAEASRIGGLCFRNGSFSFSSRTTSPSPSSFSGSDKDNGVSAMFSTISSFLSTNTISATCSSYKMAVASFAVLAIMCGAQMIVVHTNTILNINKIQYKAVK